MRKLRKWLTAIPRKVFSPEGIPSEESTAGNSHNPQPVPVLIPPAFLPASGDKYIAVDFSDLTVDQSNSPYQPDESPAPPVQYSELGIDSLLHGILDTTHLKKIDRLETELTTVETELTTVRGEHETLSGMFAVVNEELGSSKRQLEIYQARITLLDEERVFLSGELKSRAATTEELTQRLQTWIEVYSQLLEEKQNRETELYEIQIKYAALETSFEDSQTQNTSLFGYKTVLEEQLATSTQLAQQYEQTIAELKQALAGSEQTITDNTQQMRDKDADILNREGVIADLEAQVTSWKAQYSQFQERLEETQRLSRKMIDEHVQSINDISARFDHQLNQYEQTIADNTQQMRDKEADFVAEFGESQTLILKLEQLVTQSRKAYEVIEQQLGEADRYIGKLNTENDLLAAQARADYLRITENADSVAQLTEQLEESNTELQAASEQLEETQTKFGALQQNLEETLFYNITQLGEKREIEGKLTVSQNLAQQYEQTIAELKQALAGSEQTITDNTQQMRDKDADILNREGVIADLEAQVTSLKAQYSQFQERLEETQRLSREMIDEHVQSINDISARFDHQLNQYEQTIADNASRVTQLTEQLNASNTELQAASEQFEETQTRYDGTQKRLEESLVKILASSGEKTALEGQVQSLGKRLQDADKQLQASSKSFQEMIADHEQVIDEYESRINKITTASAALIQELKDVHKKTIDEYDLERTTAATTFVAEMQTSEEVIAARTKEADDWKCNYVSAEQSLNTSYQTITDLTARNTALVTQTSADRIRIAKQTSQNLRLNRQFELLKTEHQQEVSGLKAQYSTLQTQLEKRTPTYFRRITGEIAAVAAAAALALGIGAGYLISEDNSSNLVISSQINQPSEIAYSEPLDFGLEPSDLGLSAEIATSEQVHATSVSSTTSYEPSSPLDQSSENAYSGPLEINLSTRTGTYDGTGISEPVTEPSELVIETPTITPIVTPETWYFRIANADDSQIAPLVRDYILANGGHLTVSIPNDSTNPCYDAVKNSLIVFNNGALVDDNVAARATSALTAAGFCPSNLGPGTLEINFSR